jgi:hypothetical protein
MTDIGDEDEGRWGRARETERRRREFIRTHHPDRGGDTESFIAGLRGFDAEQAPAGPGPGPGPQPRVTVIPHRAWPTRLVTAAVRRLRPGSPPARVR